MDLVAIDADKDNEPAYLDMAIRLARGAVLVAVNIVRGSQIIHAASGDAGAHGMYDFNRRAAGADRLASVILPNRNGRNGILIAVIR